MYKVQGARNPAMHDTDPGIELTFQASKRDRVTHKEDMFTNNKIIR